MKMATNNVKFDRKPKNDEDLGEDDEEKVEFVKLVEPLLEIAKSDNLQLAALGISALVNLLNFQKT